MKFFLVALGCLGVFLGVAWVVFIVFTRGTWRGCP